MRVAALDLGTNTILCLVADVEDGRIRQIVYDNIWFVRLGQDVNRTRRFHPEALARADLALKEAHENISRLNVDRVVAVATSAARDVTNKDELFKICDKHQIPLQIISGQQEAEMTFAGGTQDIEDREGVVVVDVGGGSTEILLNTSAGLQGASVDIGSVRVTEKFITQHPITEDDWVQAQEFVREQLQAKIQFATTAIQAVIAVAGTPTTLAAMDIGISFDSEKLNGKKLSLEHLQMWATRLKALTPPMIVEQFQIELKRADVIAAGVLILIETLAHLKVDQLIVSTKGVRYGLAVAIERQKI